MKLRLPFLGRVLHRFALSEFSRSLATLLTGGIPLVPSFEIAIASVGNAYVRSRIEPTIQMVREGKPFYAALEKSGIFTDMSIDMVKVGEATGSLDEMLSSVSDFLDEQVETRMQRLLSLVEPMMLVFMGHHHRDPADLDLPADVLDARFVEVLAPCGWRPPPRVAETGLPVSSDG